MEDGGSSQFEGLFNRQTSERLLYGVTVLSPLTDDEERRAPKRSPSTLREFKRRTSDRLRCGPVKDKSDSGVCHVTRGGVGRGASNKRPPSTLPGKREATTERWRPCDYPVIYLHGQQTQPESDPMRRKRELLLKRKLPIQFSVPVPLDSDEAKNLLEKIMRAARIIHLDWVELYFAEDNKYVSIPRNELEALSSILSSIDESISRHESERKNALLMLRRAAISSVEALGVMQEEVMTRVSGANDDDRKKLNWWKEQGIKTKLDIAYFHEAGRGLVASDDIHVGDVVLEIPTHLVISEDVMRRDMESWSDDFRWSLGPVYRKLLWILQEWNDPNSKYKDHFDFLPKEFKTEMSLGPDAVDAFKGTPMYSSLLYGKQRLEVSVNCINCLLERPDWLPHRSCLKSCTLDDCKRAWGLWHNYTMDVLFSAGEWKRCLMPVACFFNHSQLPHILYGSYDSRGDTIKFIASRPCKKGEQCFLTYGHGDLSGECFIRNYGFLPKGVNNCDVIHLDFEDIFSRSCRVEVFGEIDWPYQMVRERSLNPGGKKGWTQAMLTYIHSFMNENRFSRTEV